MRKLRPKEIAQGHFTGKWQESEFKLRPPDWRPYFLPLTLRIPQENWLCLIRNKLRPFETMFYLNTTVQELRVFHGTVDFGGWIILCCGERPMHSRMFSSLPGLYPLAPHPLPPSCDNHKCIQPFPNIPMGVKSPQAENLCNNPNLLIYLLIM